MDSNRIEHSLHSQYIHKLSQSGTEHIHYPAICHFLPENYRLYALETLNETEENKAKGIQKLNEFLKREKLTCPDSSFLIMVLRCCKYNIKKSEAKLKRFLKARQLIIRRLVKMNMETIEQMVDNNTFSVLPYRDKHGRCIFYTQANPQLDKYEMDDMGYLALAAILFSLSFSISQVCGAVYIPDNTYLSLSVYYPIANTFRKLAPFITDIPLRLARVDITNENFLCRWIYALLRPILPGKITKRVLFHGSNFENLHKFYHSDMLPEDVGGTMGPVGNKHYREHLLNFIEKLRREN